MENIKQRLTEKSIEAFIMGLEIYNKPTIKYRIEGFSFFIINAWELMLKAALINRGESIYFSDKPDRTLSVENVIKKIYTDKNTRIRLNLEKIIELRNISTHYITEDYEVKLSNRRLSRAISADYFRRKHLSQSAVNEAKAHYIGCHRRLSRAYFSSAMAGLK